MSSTLFASLAALGGVALAGLVVHGAWQARKAGPKRAEPVPPESARELREPTMDGEAPAAEGVDFDPSELPPMSATDEDAPASPEPWLQPRKSVARLDGLIDAIAVLALEAPVSGEMVIAHLPPSRRAGGKPFLIEGLNAVSGEWEPPAADQRYGELQAGVLLANRTGALNEIEYSEFVQKVQAFADALGAMAQFPDMLDAASRARELDAFGSQYDAQLVVRLQASSVAWSVGYVHQQAAKRGFVVGAVPGRMVLPAGQGTHAAEEGAPPVLVLSFDSQAALAEDPNQAAVRDMSLSFDVPQTEASANPFETWQTTAQALAADIDARLIDDNGNPLENAGFALIGGELAKLYEALEARGLPAGSMAARRLFS